MDDDELTDDNLEKQKIWTRVTYDGYFYKLNDLDVCVQIEIEPTEKKEGEITCTTTIMFPPLEEKNGNIELTALLHTFLMKIKENPGKNVRCYLTGFGRKLKFNEDLLKHPIPQELIDMFKI